LKEDRNIIMDWDVTG